MKSMARGFRTSLGALLLAATLFFPPLFPAQIMPGEIPRLPSHVLEFEQVRKAYEKVREDPENGQPNGRLGMILHAHRRYEFAAVYYERAALLQPRSFRWAYYRAVVQSELGYKVEAAAILRTALGLDPDYFPGQLKLAELLLSVGNFPESIKAYQALIERHPESSLAHYGLGQAQSVQGELVSAAESYRRACKWFPGFGAAHYALAIAYRDLGDPDKSEEQFSLFQKNPEERPELEDPLLQEVIALAPPVNSHLAEGLRLESEGRLQEAIDEYQQALQHNSHLWEAHVQLIPVYVRQGKWDQAKEHYDSAARLNPYRWENHSNFGVLLGRAGRYQEAADAFRKALEINPLSAQAHSGLAELLIRKGHWEEATTHCHLALENDPHSRLAHFTLGRILQSRGKNSEAIDHFLKTLKIDDEMTPLFLFTVSDSYARAGKPQKAIQFAKRARQQAISLGQTSLATDIEKFVQLLER